VWTHPPCSPAARLARTRSTWGRRPNLDVEQRWMETQKRESAPPRPPPAPLSPTCPRAAAWPPRPR
jgi:hypothetical protein